MPKQQPAAAQRYAHHSPILIQHHHRSPRIPPHKPSTRTKEPKNRGPSIKHQASSIQNPESSAAAEKAYAAIQLYKLIYPEREYYKPDTITRKQHEASTDEILAVFDSIATDEQMEQLRRVINKAMHVT